MNKMSELPFMQQAIMAEIKKHNTDVEGLNEYNKRIEFISSEPYESQLDKETFGRTWFFEWDEDKKEYERIDQAYMKLLVRCKFKPIEKGERDIVKYKVFIYSDGNMTVLYDGSDWFEY